MKTCANPACGNLFKPKAPNLKCCCAACGIAYKRTPEYRERLRIISAASWQTPSPGRIAGIEKLRRTKASPESSARRSELNRLQWADPEYKARVGASISAALLREEVSALISRLAIERWTDPAFRKRTTAAIAAGQQTPMARANHSAASRRRLSDPDQRQKYDAAIKKAQGRFREICADPLARADLIERIVTARKAAIGARTAAHIITADEVIDAMAAIILSPDGKRIAA